MPNSSLATIYEFSQLWYYVGAMMILDISFGMLSAAKAGMLETEECFNGVCKKIAILGIIVFALLLERATQTPVFKLTCSFYIVYEALSVVENLGILGVPLPRIITQAVAILKQQNESPENDKVDNSL
jgi:toxin secretion/phage lysis holin